MTTRVVEHKIKLEKSVKIILGVLAFGVFLDVFAPAFSVREAFAESSSGLGDNRRSFIVRFVLSPQKDNLGHTAPYELDFKCKDCN